MARTGVSKNRKWLIAPTILIILAGSGLIYNFTQVNAASSWAVIYKRLLYPLFKLILFLAFGLFAGILIEGLGWTHRIAQWIRPMTKWGRLKDESGAAFVTSFVSSVTSNAMLMEYYRAGRLSRKELILTYLLNTGLPVYIAHFPTTFFIVSSLAGTAGLIYMLITFCAAVMRSMSILMYTRYSFGKNQPTWSILVDEPAAGESAKDLVLRRFRDRFTRLVLYTVPIFTLIFLLNQWGGFQILRQGAVGILPADCFPVEAVGLIMFTLAAEFSSGMAAAGALLQTGALTIKQTALALIVGSIISTPIRALRHQLPAYVGLFDLSLGTQLIFLSQSFRIISLLAIAIPYAMVGSGDVCTVAP